MSKGSGVHRRTVNPGKNEDCLDESPSGAETTMERKRDGTLVPSLLVFSIKPTNR